MANAGPVAADQIDVVEAHGYRAPPLGDPIEAQALIATYGQDRADGPAAAGSARSSRTSGHMQAAAGVGGVIKMVMALRNETLPRTLHVDAPTSHVDWSAGGRPALTEETALARVRPAASRGGRPPSVSAAPTSHTIIEEAAPEPAPETAVGSVDDEHGHTLYALSARTAEALRRQAGELAGHLRAAAGVAARRRGVLAGDDSVAAFEHRAAVAGRRPGGTARRVWSALGEGATRCRVWWRGTRSDGSLAFVFSGQGSQRVGMGRGLYGVYPVFADALDEVCAQFDGELGRPLREVLLRRMPGVVGSDRCTRRRVCLLLRWRCSGCWSRGVWFRICVAGHSVGELVAAYVAGVWSLADACRLVAARGRLMGALPVGGAMVAVQGAEDEVRGALVGREGEVSVAAVNGPGCGCGFWGWGWLLMSWLRGGGVRVGG